MTFLFIRRNSMTPKSSHFIISIKRQHSGLVIKVALQAHRLMRSEEVVHRTDFVILILQFCNIHDP